MSYEKKIFAGILIAIIAFLPVLGLSIFTIQTLIHDQNTIIEANAKERLLVERLQFFNAAQGRQIPVYLLSGDKAELESYYRFHELFNTVLGELQGLETDRVDRVLLDKLKKDSDSAYSFIEPGIKMLSQGRTIKDVERFFRSKRVPLNKAVTEAGQQLALSAADHESIAHLQIDRSVARLKLSITALAFFAIFLAAFSALLIRKVSRQKRISDEQNARISVARKEIVEVVSHDLKSPLTAIQMTVGLMRARLPKDPAFSYFGELINAIDRSAKSMTSLIVNLLDHAKIESGNLVLESKPCDLSRLTEEISKRFETLVIGKHIHLDTITPSENLISHCDPVRIDQAISNLLSNAIKFTPKDGEIKLSCRKAGQNILISIEDSGPGLSREQIPYIFDRFWQARKTSDQGTGLGLAIVKSIVDAHHGRIWVESEVGRGCKFNLTLPL